MTERQRAKKKWTKAGKLRGRPAGSRSYDPETSRSGDPPVREPERRGRPPVALKPMILRLIQMETGFRKANFAKQLAKEAVGNEIKEETVKRRLRRDRSEARKRQERRKYSTWTFD